MSAAAFSCITSKMQSSSTVTNSWCPLVLYSCKSRQSAARVSEPQLKVNAETKQVSSNLQSKARLSCGGIGVRDSSRRGLILLRRLPFVVNSSQGKIVAPFENSVARALNFLNNGSLSDPADDDETPLDSLDLPVVKVKFLLQKECLFGQKFSVVGEDILLGAWDPNAAFNLEWSKDHTWTGELDLPLGKKYEFKFLLTDEDGEVHWQPGPNHIFETLENVTPLIVSEPWYSEETDKIDDVPAEVSAALSIDDVPAEVSESLSIPEDINVGNFNVVTEASKETLDIKQDETGNGGAAATSIESVVATVLLTSTGDTEEQQAINSED